MQTKLELRNALALEYFFFPTYLTIDDLYNGAKIVNLPLAVVEIWFLKILNFDFRFGQKVKVKLRSPSCKYYFDN